MASRDVAAASEGFVVGGGARGPSFSSSPVAATSLGTTRGVQVAPCSFTALRLLDLVPAPPCSFGEAPLIALRSWGNRSYRKPGLPSFLSTSSTQSCRVISPSLCSWLARHDAEPPPQSPLVCEGALGPVMVAGARAPPHTRRSWPVVASSPGVLGGFVIAASCIPSTAVHHPCTGCLPYDLSIFARKYVKFPFWGSKGSRP
jgi:hypothetical protein